MMFGGGKKGGGKGGMDDVLKAARRASAAKVLLEAAKPVPKKVDRLAELQKRFDALVGVHTQTEALFATGGGDLPASLPPSRMAPEAAPSLPLPPRSAGGSLCYAIGEQPGGQLSNSNPNPNPNPRQLSNPNPNPNQVGSSSAGRGCGCSPASAHRRCAGTRPSPGPASEPQPCVFRLHPCALQPAAMRTQPACGTPSLSTECVLRCRRAGLPRLASLAALPT